MSVLLDDTRWPALEEYVSDVLTRYACDERVLLWDLYNEPCNSSFDQNSEKAFASARLVDQVFAWARAVNPTQPLTVCVWSDPDALRAHDETVLSTQERELLRAQRIALGESDVISFHNYSPAADLEQRIVELAQLGRPVLCTEYMARTQESLFLTCLPVLHRHRVAAYNWGFVAGKSGTIFPWGSQEGGPEPQRWFHDILREDGSAFDEAETHMIRELTSQASPNS